MVAAALEPRATPAPHHLLHRRDTIVDGLDVSAILANPSSYLKEASSLFKKHPEYASQFSKMTDKPAFIKSLSQELASQFGSKTAAIALQQYTAINNGDNAPAGTAAAQVGAAASSGATKIAAVLSSASATASAGSPLSSALGILGSATSGAFSFSASAILISASIASMASIAFNFI